VILKGEYEGKRNRERKGKRQKERKRKNRIYEKLSIGREEE
jgi:hypothetical protein